MASTKRIFKSGAERSDDPDRNLGEGGFGADQDSLPRRSPQPDEVIGDAVIRTDPDPKRGKLSRQGFPRGTERPPARTTLPRTSSTPESQLGADATPPRPTTPIPEADGAPSVFTPLPSPSPQTLVGRGPTASAGGPTAATPADGIGTGDGIPSAQSSLDPRTFGTLPGSPVLGAGGGLLGGGLTTPSGLEVGGEGEAEADDLLAAILAMLEGGAI